MAGTEIHYYERGRPELLREPVLAGNLLAWAYQDAKSGWLHRLAFRSSILSRLLGAYYSSRLSRGKIRQAIEYLQIDVSEFRDRVESFTSFNKFFTRYLKAECRPCDHDPQALSSPADGRTLVFPKLQKDLVIPVKGCRYSVDALLDRPAPEYHNGAAAVIRLCPADYHRFHFPCAGRITGTRRLKGAYYSVNPIALALGLNIFCENKCACSIIENEYFGKFCSVEVGAFGVGSIVWTFEGEQVEKMQEKGYFEFGGSTIILIFAPGKVEFSADLVANSATGYETLVKVGQTIATARA